MVTPISEVRKPAIVQAAIKTIGQHGLPTPSYDLIADEAGMSRQLIRHYFPDPEALMVSVCDGLAAAYKEALMKGILSAGKTERLPMFLDFYFNFLAPEGLAKPADDQVYDAMLSLATSSEKVRKNLHDQYALLQFTIAHEVQISNPALPQSACREIGYLFVALMYGHWKMVATLGFSEDNNRVSRAAIDRLIASYADHYDDPDDPVPGAVPQ
ncbi:TetR/AcrR family transcriptional regulator [Thalassococcus sp. BH17M4-6]|uniref:TetR/AcrR family transcriptional regulator n=1 Tax=Thalassococcus sp. BH17M4-6 TaxID=3413148 RepID=UPI003BD15CB9